MEQAIRNKLRNVVTQCRKLLEESVRQELQGRFGIYAAKKNDIQVDDDARMTHLDADDLAARKDILDHLDHITARGFNPQDGLDQLIREIAFTHLNRFCAYKMMEARKVHVGGQKFREAVSRGLKSQGFLFYLADHPEYEQLYKSGKQDLAYRKFLDWLGETLSEEIGVLFNPSDPANRVYPPQRVLDEVLDLVNTEELIDIWTEDETIGWVYQYFTPKELRDKARKESQAPRNSYELAFRNQFFTPRYVVEFLTDNTLGRIWYEMRKGDTSLTERCRYLVRRPTENFLKEGEEPPAASNDALEDLSHEELLKQPVYIPHRPKKDPREIKILDPACGSGHFLLYCFDLLHVVYEESYNDTELSEALRQDYPDPDDFRREVPRLILKHNLHGIDIDLRATQIAALALWLRCQRAYQEMGLKDGQRPKIRRSNIVCAEPMPGETDILKEFTATLQPKVLGQLVEAVFEKMKLAGEAGSLLKIEEEISDATMKAVMEYQNELRWQKEQDGYLPGMAPPRESTLFDFSDMTDSEFLNRAAEEIVAALRQYVEKTTNGKTFRRRLFAEDATRGFGFVELLRQNYDVVLMNPPFGEASSILLDYADRVYPTWNQNVLCAFIERGWHLSKPYGALGAIYDRTAIVKSTYKDFRKAILLPDNRLSAMADLGWGVLEANVEVTTSVLHHQPATDKGTFIDCREIDVDEKSSHIENYVTDSSVRMNRLEAIYKSGVSFLYLPNAVIGYDFPEFLIVAFRECKSLESSGFKANQGHALKASKHFRLWWEVPRPTSMGFVARMFNGSGFAPYLTALYESVIAIVPPESLPRDTATVIRNLEAQMLPGICFGKRGEFFCAHVLPRDHIFTVEGQSIPVIEKNRALEALALLNTPLIRFSLNKYCGQHKYSGYVNLLPYRCLSNIEECRTQVELAIYSVREAQRLDETQSVFAIHPLGKAMTASAALMTQSIEQAMRVCLKAEDVCHEESIRTYKLSEEERKQIDSFRARQPNLQSPIDDTDLVSGCKGFVAHGTISMAIGTVFGRWDVRMAMDPSLAPKLPDPFDSLPICPPGMLVSPDGLPAGSGRIVSTEWLLERQDANALPHEGSVANPTVPDEKYPIRISWDGVLVDNPEHEDDVVRRVRNALEVIWKDSSEAIEKEACEILGIRELRDYFRKPGNVGFWMDHVKRYSKSRRKAPIYWYLRSAKGNYGLWLYYHRLDKDILFKSLVNYVEPKIRLEEERLKEFRVRKQAAGSSGREAKQIEKDMDRQEQFVSELQDFSDKLRRAADLHLDPDLNDGVVLNIAPLWELVPWKEAKKYWEELLEGKYEWSSIGKQLREKGIVK